MMFTAQRPDAPTRGTIGSMRRSRALRLPAAGHRFRATPPRSRARAASRPGRPRSQWQSLRVIPLSLYQPGRGRQGCASESAQYEPSVTFANA